jgi:heterodisulfide reductase subunit C
MSYVHPDQAFTKEVIDAGASTLNLCFQCGTCTGSCPSGRFTAFRTRKLIRRAQLGLRDILQTDDLWYCTTCYTCYERCPRGVDIPGIILTIRNMAAREGYMSDAHRETARLLVKTGHLVPLTDEYKSIRKGVGLEEMPPTALMYGDAVEKVKTIVKKTGFSKLIGTDE